MHGAHPLCCKPCLLLGTRDNTSQQCCQMEQGTWFCKSRAAIVLRVRSSRAVLSCAVGRVHIFSTTGWQWGSIGRRHRRRGICCGVRPARCLQAVLGSPRS